jgi:hypothetical protein
MKDPREVSPLSRGVMWRAFNPYPPHYRMTFASSLIRYPQRHRLALQRAGPLSGSATGLSRSAYMPGRVRPCFIRRWSTRLRWARIQRPYLTTLPFGSSLSAPLACSFLTTFTRSSLVLAIPSNPSARTALMLAVAIAPRGLNCHSEERGYIVPGASHR